MQWEESRYFSFGEEIEEQASPETFGPATPIYEEMLRESGVIERLKRHPCPQVGLIGTALHTRGEFGHFVNGINGNSRKVIIDLSDTPLKGEKGTNTMTVQKDGRDTGLPDSSFDAIFTNLLMHHLPQPTTQSVEELLLEVHRLLADGGGFFGLEYIGHEFQSADWKSNYSNKEETEKHEAQNVQALLQRIGFTSCRVEQRTGLTRQEYIQRTRSDTSLKLWGKYVNVPISGLAISAVK